MCTQPATPSAPPGHSPSVLSPPTFHSPAWPQDEALKIFVATVPVLLDSLFKVCSGRGSNKDKQPLPGAWGMGLRAPTLLWRLGPSCLPCCVHPSMPAEHLLLFAVLTLLFHAFPPLPDPPQVWIFVGLNKADPAAAVTLKQMDRH